jgi:cysteine desulfurase
LCVGLGEAARLAKLEMQEDLTWIKYLNDKLYTGLNKNLSHLVLNGDKL